MKNLKKILYKLAIPVTTFILMIGMSSVASACFWTYHQPKVPESMDMYRG